MKDCQLCHAQNVQGLVGKVYFLQFVYIFLGWSVGYPPPLSHMHEPVWLFLNLEKTAMDGFVLVKQKGRVEFLVCDKWVRVVAGR